MANSITPPPELLEHWEDQHYEEGENYDVMLIQAYQAGADQELKACLTYAGNNGISITRMRATRRPQPPTLKEQAMRVLVENGTNLDGRMELDSTDIDTIRRALEALDD
jgi:hypothetical protein